MQEEVWPRDLYGQSPVKLGDEGIQGSRRLTFVTFIDVGMRVLTTVFETNCTETCSAFWLTTFEGVASVIVIKCRFAAGALKIDFISQLIEYFYCLLIPIFCLGSVEFTTVKIDAQSCGLKMEV